MNFYNADDGMEKPQTVSQGALRSVYQSTEYRYVPPPTPDAFWGVRHINAYVDDSRAHIPWPVERQALPFILGTKPVPRFFHS